MRQVILPHLPMGLEYADLKSVAHFCTGPLTRESNLIPHDN